MAKRQRTRRYFSPEFKPETIELIRSSGRSIPEVCRELDLAAVADALDGRPRKTLGWRTPAEALNELLRSA